MHPKSVLSFITKDSSKHEGPVLAQEKEKLHAANTRNYFPSNIFSTCGTLEKWKNSKISIKNTKYPAIKVGYNFTTKSNINYLASIKMCIYFGT
jgi:hypothetical protein